MSSFFLGSLIFKMSSLHKIRFGRHVLDLAVPQVMGILNITPDSFSDGGELHQAGEVKLSAVLERAQAMVSAGASMLDVGGESTRPGAASVSEAEEADRVLPVIDMLVREFKDVVISVDTSNASVMRDSAVVGAGLINDVRSLSRPGALEAAAESGLPVCLMHIKGVPATMQHSPEYDDVVSEVFLYLQGRIKICQQYGIAADRILIDPGFGFGKNLQHNLELLNNLEHFMALNVPLLVGLSRKRMLGTITGKAEKERVAAGLAAAVIAVYKGARIVRTHDVAETVDALKVCSQVINATTRCSDDAGAAPIT